MNDTIAAISTALGVGAIAIIRVSGKDAIKIVNKIFKGTNLCNVPTHTIHYGHIIDGNAIIDEVLVSVFKAPKTFTTEDIVEINSHGSIASTNKILEILLLNGCRLAEPGEFSKRAFLNGRIDLVEAEGIMDMINSKTEKARKLAMNQVDGKVSRLIDNLRDDLAQILSNIEVNIDYPEYEDILQLTIDDLKPKIENIDDKVTKILQQSEDGKIVKNGINVGILGRPNAGKSSLLNNLLNEDKAIVTDVQGTTRDFVEGSISLMGIPLNIIDTAGIRETNNIVEKIGVDKSLNLIDKADLIILMLDNSKSINDDELALYNKIKTKKHIVVLNKIDLSPKINLSKIPEEVINISTLKNIGIDKLTNKIKTLFNLEQLETSDLTYLSNADSISKLREVHNLIINIKQALNNNIPIDMIEIDIKTIWNLLGEITGKNYDDELIDQLFSRFCVGK